MPADESENDGHDPMQTMRLATAERLCAARGERSGIVAAIKQFLDEGMAIVYSPSALWDFFATSSPSVAKLSGYDAAEQDRITRIFSAVSHNHWGATRPLPPDWPWYERDDAQHPHDPHS